MSVQSTKWFRRLGIFFTAIVLALVAFRAGVRVIEGQAAETFTNAKGVNITWGTAFVFFASLIAAFGAALFARWWEGRGGWLRFARFSRPRIGRRENDGRGEDEARGSRDDRGTDRIDS